MNETGLELWHKKIRENHNYNELKFKIIGTGEFQCGMEYITAIVAIKNDKEVERYEF